jgi:hypothetical protein
VPGGIASRKMVVERIIPVGLFNIFVPDEIVDMVDTDFKQKRLDII